MRGFKLTLCCAVMLAALACAAGQSRKLLWGNQQGDGAWTEVGANLDTQSGAAAEAAATVNDLSLGRRDRRMLWGNQWGDGPWDKVGANTDKGTAQATSAADVLSLLGRRDRK